MAQDGFYHCSVKAVGRSSGRSAVAAAAYRSGECLTDTRTGLMHDYRAKGGIVASFLVTPADAPAWASDRSAVWNAVEKATTAKNGRLATELELALPCELSAEERRALVGDFARSIADKHNVVVDVAIHEPGRNAKDHRNHHAHVLVSHREIVSDGFGKIANSTVREKMEKGKLVSRNISGAFNEEDIIPTRQAWAECVNRAYEKAGLETQVDHRSHVERGLAAEPTVHLGPSASGMERRGDATSRGDINRSIAARNGERQKIDEERLSVSAAIAQLVAEREAREDVRALRAATRTASADRILEAMTEKRATFTRTELFHTLRKATEDRALSEIMATELLAHPSIIGLRETADAAVTRYTTREVLASERQVLQDGRALVADGHAGLSNRQKASAMQKHPRLDEEQREAFDHATGKRGLAIIAGEAGTGKSTTLAAIRDAYEGAGYRVVGMAWTNSVVQDMQADGFKDASTIAAALGRLDRGKDAWNRKTVLVVDEAAMLSSKHLGRVMEKAREAGAKVILAGDEKQLASIERGGMFGALEAEHGAAELHTVRRVQEDAQRRAFNHMHAGEFGAALDLFDKAGAIAWTETQDEAKAALVGQWAKDTQAEPGKSRFVFAYSNADVATFNTDLRAIRRARGELGEDTILPTRDGPTAFAPGDRVQFTASGYGQRAKALGLVTGGMGVVRGIEEGRMTVELDGRNGKPRRSVSFAVGSNEQAGQFDAIRHGYAGTIYKGQGRTLDQTYLYHSQNWRAASGYVALSRHRESTKLFVARDVTRGREPWAIGEGGLDALDDRQRQAADRAYQTWAEDHPKVAERFGLAEYVSFVQGKQVERGRSAYDMEQLTRQMSRADETRAASRFVVDDARLSEGAGKTIQGRRSSPTGKYDVLRGAGIGSGAVATPQIAKLTVQPVAVQQPALPALALAVSSQPTAGKNVKDVFDNFVSAETKVEADAAWKKREQEAAKGKVRPKGNGLEM